MQGNDRGGVVMSGGDRLQIPLALVVLGFVLMVGFQTVQLVRERGNAGAKAVIDEMRRQGITIKGN